MRFKFGSVEKERTDNAEIDQSVIAHRLKEDLLEQSGKLRRTVADLYEPVEESAVHSLRCNDHKLPITCLTISADCQTLYSASKDCTVIKWSLSEMKKLAVLKRIDKKSGNDVKGHKSVVQSLAVSSDGKFLASGDLDNVIHVWDPVSMKWIHTFRGENSTDAP